MSWRSREDTAYKREFEKERQRLAQLWDAYEEADREREELRKRLEKCEAENQRLRRELEAIRPDWR